MQVAAPSVPEALSDGLDKFAERTGLPLEVLGDPWLRRWGA